MKVLIVGWYGTETIGDRAILLGIFQILEAFPIEEIFLGSLFPFFTERTIYQDSELIKNKLPNTKISIVDIRDRDKLKNAVKDSSSVIMGGGPLMGLNELTYILRAFKYARIYKKSTGLIGIGLEKGNNSQYLKLIMKILNLSDLIIYRDQNSMLYSKDLGIKQKNQFVLSDPAILPCEEFLGVSAKEDRIVINFREYDIDSDKFNYMKTIVDYAANYFDEVILYPNHTFVEGGDDRNILSNIVLSVGKSNVRVIQRPPSFSDVCTLIRASRACIGMRYHAVLMQTLLNGNNFIIDYTNPKNGKIVSFLDYYGLSNEYSKYYQNIDGHDISKLNDILKCLSLNERIPLIDNAIYQKTKEDYVRYIKKIL